MGVALEQMELYELLHGHDLDADVTVFPTFGRGAGWLDDQSGERGSHLATDTSRGVAHDLLGSDGDFAAVAVAVTAIGAGSRRVLFRIDVGRELGGRRLDLSFVWGPRAG